MVDCVYALCLYVGGCWCMCMCVCVCVCMFGWICLGLGCGVLVLVLVQVLVSRISRGATAGRPSRGLAR